MILGQIFRDVLWQVARDASWTLSKGIVGTGSGLYIAAVSSGEALAHSFGVYCAAVAGFLTVVSLALNVAKGIRGLREGDPHKHHKRQHRR